MSTKNAENQTKQVAEQVAGQMTDQMTDNNVEKIRDILFGGNMRDYDKRFARLEDRLVSDIERLSQDVFKRFENLDNYIRKEFEDLTNKLHDEKSERKTEHEANISELKSLQKQTENRFSDSEQQQAAEARTLRSSMHEQGNELLEMVRTTRDEVMTNITKESRELQDVKVARSDLAELFTEVALRLNRDFNLPE